MHHINGDRTDNRIENIQLLCCNCHAQTDNFCGKNIKKKERKSICKQCGKQFDKNGKKFCSDECKDKYVRNKLKKISKCPEKDILLSEFKELKSFVQIGNKYGVSDKSVSKWFQKYNLPFRSKELKTYINNL